MTPGPAKKEIRREGHQCCRNGSGQGPAQSEGQFNVPQQLPVRQDHAACSVTNYRVYVHDSGVLDSGLGANGRLPKVCSLQLEVTRTLSFPP